MASRQIQLSVAERLAAIPPEQRKELLTSFPKDVQQSLLRNWRLWARPEQMPPASDWRIWLILAGRGWGKSRTGAEWIQAAHKKYRRIHLVGRTAGDVRDVMVEGPSGVCSITSGKDRPKYSPAKKRLQWDNGSIALLFSSDEPESLRGPQCEAFWGDEVCAWRYVQECWDQLMMGFRLGSNPRGIVTTTPKPLKLVKRLLQDPTVAVTRGRTYDNIANLAPAFIDQVIKPYEGTRLGRQELEGEVVDDLEGALWSAVNIHEHRVDAAPDDLERVVVGVDPGTSDNEESAETGIIIVAKGKDGHAYVLADRSIKGSPDTWARTAVTAYHAYSADKLVAETNQGGAMVESTVKTVDPSVNYKGVHASRGKVTRAEPIAALYEQGKVHHVGAFAKLEDQQCSYVPGMTSPDRMDALVHALTELMLTPTVNLATPHWDLSIGRRANPWTT